MLHVRICAGGAGQPASLPRQLGVHVVRSVRRVVLHLPRATPHLEAWRHIALALGARAG